MSLLSPVIPVDHVEVFDTIKDQRTETGGQLDASPAAQVQPPPPQPPATPPIRTEVEDPPVPEDETPGALGLDLSRALRPRLQPASSHRLRPLAPPGQDVITLLKQQESQGLHLAIKVREPYI